MEQNVSRHAILEKINKILEMADRGSKHEAAVAAAKAQKLLIQFNISENEARGHQASKDSEIMEEIIDLEGVFKKSQGKWVMFLYSAIADHNLCSHITRTTGDRKYAILVGTKANISIVKFMAEQLINRIPYIEKLAWDCNDNPFVKRAVFRRSYLMGVVAGIRQQLENQYNALRREENKVNALIVQTDKLLDEFKAKHYRLRAGRGGSIGYGTAYLQGREKGKNLSLRKGVGSKGNFGGLLK